MNKRFVEYKIESCKRDVAFWAEEELQRRRNRKVHGVVLCDSVYHDYIRFAKVHRKEAAAELAYWECELEKLT